MHQELSVSEPTLASLRFPAHRNIAKCAPPTGLVPIFRVVLGHPLPVLKVVDADVVDEDLLGEAGCVVGVAGPFAADGEVERDEERVVVSPGLSGGRSCGVRVA